MAFAGIALAWLHDPLASESLTLTTYYPSPLGVYASLITTGLGGVNTLLARDAGSVGVGTSSPNALFNAVGRGGGTVANLQGGANDLALQATNNTAWNWNSTFSNSNANGYGIWSNANWYPLYTTSVNDGSIANYSYASGDGSYGVFGYAPGRTGALNTTGMYGYGTQYGVRGYADTGVWGQSSGNNSGVYGTSNNGNGVYGQSSNGSGVNGTSTSGAGVWGNSSSNWGVIGISPNSAILGEATNSGGIGVLGFSVGAGIALLGENVGNNGYGVIGYQLGNGGAGVYGYGYTQAAMFQGPVTINDGTQASNYVLTSDGSGNARWAKTQHPASYVNSCSSASTGWNYCGCAGGYYAAGQTGINCMNDWSCGITWAGGWFYISNTNGWTASFQTNCIAN